MSAFGKSLAAIGLGLGLWYGNAAVGKDITPGQAYDTYGINAIKEVQKTNPNLAGLAGRVGTEGGLLALLPSAYIGIKKRRQ
ncbi:MAG: hypothetical protein AABX27_04745 [Nanoarchaeota archaeon]|mgnify:CR=1 FL=1